MFDFAFSWPTRKGDSKVQCLNYSEAITETAHGRHNDNPSAIDPQERVRVSDSVRPGKAGPKEVNDAIEIMKFGTSSSGCESRPAKEDSPQPVASLLSRARAPAHLLRGGRAGAGNWPMPRSVPSRSARHSWSAILVCCVPPPSGIRSEVRRTIAEVRDFLTGRRKDDTCRKACRPMRRRRPRRRA